MEDLPRLCSEDLDTAFLSSILGKCGYVPIYRKDCLILTAHMAPSTKPEADTREQCDRRGDDDNGDATWPRPCLRSPVTTMTLDRKPRMPHSVRRSSGRDAGKGNRSPEALEAGLPPWCVPLVTSCSVCVESAPVAEADQLTSCARGHQ